MKKILSAFPFYKNSLVVGPDVNHVRDCVKTASNKRLREAFSVYSFKDWKAGALNLIKKLFTKIFSYGENKKRTCKAFKYLNNVIKYSKKALDALTWHHYYLNGHTCTLKDFLNITVLEGLRREITELNGFIAKIFKRLFCY